MWPSSKNIEGEGLAPVQEYRSCLIFASKNKESEKLHYPLLLFTGDKCRKDLQQLQFVAGHNF